MGQGRPTIEELWVPHAYLLLRFLLFLTRMLKYNIQILAFIHELMPKLGQDRYVPLLLLLML